MTLDPNKKFNDLTPEEFAEFNQVRRWGADLYKGFHDRELDAVDAFFASGTGLDVVGSDLGGLFISNRQGRTVGYIVSIRPKSARVINLLKEYEDSVKKILESVMDPGAKIRISTINM